MGPVVEHQQVFLNICHPQLVPDLHPELFESIFGVMRLVVVEMLQDEGGVLDQYDFEFRSVDFAEIGFQRAVDQIGTGTRELHSGRPAAHYRNRHEAL